MNGQRVALVTGGTQGLGAAAAAALYKDGFRVVVTAPTANAAAAADAARNGFLFEAWDVADEAACREGIDRVAATAGPIDVLVNNAGITRDRMFHKMTLEEWRSVLSTDLDSMFNMCRPVICGMRERGYGRIINLSSVNALKGQSGQTNYCAAKAGVLGFTRALALESAAKGITVNAIAPGYCDTAMVAAVDESIRNRIVSTIPVGRLGQPAEIGRVVAFLASENAGFITGATFSVNGGMYLG